MLQQSSFPAFVKFNSHYTLRWIGGVLPWAPFLIHSIFSRKLATTSFLFWSKISRPTLASAYFRSVSSTYNKIIIAVNNTEFQGTATFTSIIELHNTLTFQNYFTTSQNYVMADAQPGIWLCKLYANCSSKSKTIGNRNTANEKSTIWGFEKLNFVAKTCC